MPERTIEEIVDLYLQKWADLGINMLPREIDSAMAGPTTADGWTFWYPIPSKATDEEIQDFEEQIGHRFPTDYKRYLKYKHFYDLHIAEANFTHPVNTWRREHVDMIDGGYPREFLIDKGYLSIASWSDWGLLCFDTNAGDEDHNYPVVLWDHERARHVTPLYRNFTELMRGLDLEASENDTDKQ
jgi:SMI1-KNR4 cell-wall